MCRVLMLIASIFIALAILNLANKDKNFPIKDNTTRLINDLISFLLFISIILSWYLAPVMIKYKGM